MYTSVYIYIYAISHFFSLSDDKIKSSKVCDDKISVAESLSSEQNEAIVFVEKKPEDTPICEDVKASADFPASNEDSTLQKFEELSAAESTCKADDIVKEGIENQVFEVQNLPKNSGANTETKFASIEVEQKSFDLFEDNQCK